MTRSTFRAIKAICWALALAGILAAHVAQARDNKSRTDQDRENYKGIFNAAIGGNLTSRVTDVLGDSFGADGGVAINVAVGLEFTNYLQWNVIDVGFSQISSQGIIDFGPIYSYEQKANWLELGTSARLGYFADGLSGWKPYVLGGLNGSRLSDDTGIADWGFGWRVGAGFTKDLGWIGQDTVAAGVRYEYAEASVTSPVEVATHRLLVEIQFGTE